MALVVPMALLLQVAYGLDELKGHMAPIVIMVVITPMALMALPALMNDLYGSLRAPML